MEHLELELGRLETQLGESTPDSRVIGELAAMRGSLARPQNPGAPFKLPNLRVASPCKERWDDMTGDERVRVCNGCDRPVFNLSEMTRDQAEAVLATRGIKPCVRFFQRFDGTVMTKDCPTTARRSRRLTVITAGTLLASSPAMAQPTPAPTTDETPTETEPTATEPTETEIEPTTDDDTEWTMGEMVMGDIAEPEPEQRSAFEWSTWARLGYGIASQPSTLAARATTPQQPESSTVGEAALGVDGSLGIARHDTLRLGAFAEWRTISKPVLGGELIVGGLSSRGHMGIVLRAGGNAQVVTGAFGVGYTAADSWLGYGHSTGFRMVTSMTRSRDAAHDWSVTVGVEFDPIGALGYLVRLGTR